MSHDFARSHRLKREASRRKPARTSGGIPSWLWLLVGTLAGCLIMFLVYLAGVAPPLPNLKAEQPAVTSSAPVASKTVEPAAPPKRVSPVFEFYTSLPEGGQPVTDIPATGQPAPAPVPPAGTPPATVPETPDPIQQLLAEKAAATMPAATGPATEKPAETKLAETKPAEAKPAGKMPEESKTAPAKGRYLQAGAFRSKTEVDKLRAKISLLGQQSSVQTTTNAKGEALYKVLVGPFRSAEDMDDAKIILGGNGINSIPVGK